MPNRASRAFWPLEAAPRCITSASRSMTSLARSTACRRTASSSSIAHRDEASRDSSPSFTRARRAACSSSSSRSRASIEAMTRPRIALTVSAAPTPANLASRENYVRALSGAGAEVIVVEPGQTIPADVDGICFSGGGDIEPRHYGDVDTDNVCENVNPARDALELAAARRALDEDLPTLGICRGFQLINVALGGTLAMDVKGHQARGDDVVAHQLAAAPGSLLARATSEDTLRVNS